MKCGTGVSLKIKAKLVKSPAKGQVVELLANDPALHYVTILGLCESKTYPLAKKHHTIEYLREQAHFRPKSNLISSVARIRNNLSYATHIFYQENGFNYIHTPLITSSDCEGAGNQICNHIK